MLELDISKIDLASYAIVALLPLSAGMVVLQVNPYHALVIRGILGAVAALVYALMGAADVALTEALVGTMLAITLYAVAVRSSLLMRLGIVQTEVPLPDRVPAASLEVHPAAATQPAPIAALETLPVPSRLDERPPQEWETTAMGMTSAIDPSTDPSTDPSLALVLANFRQVLDKRHLRLELVSYPDRQALQAAFAEKEVHAICTRSLSVSAGESAQGERSETDTPPPTSGPLTYQTQIRIRRLYEILQAELTDPVALTYTPVPDTPKVSPS